MEPTNRFLADNFGTGFSLGTVTHAIPGFFKTLCLVPSDLPESTVAGTERCLSTLEALRAISDRKATPIARFAMANAAGMSRPESLAWAFAYRLFIGSTPLDRIHFWNCRHLGGSWNDTSNALILEPSFFDDEQLVKQLGHYLNNNNFLRYGSGQNQATIHSSSMSVEQLEAIGRKLQPHTWNAINVGKNSRESVIPSQEDLVDRIHDKSTDTTILKLSEDSSEVRASEPAHFIYIPPQLSGLGQGQWIVELSIQRHNNLSRYANVVDTWTLPRRRKITSAFTDRLGKPTLSGRLAILPSTEQYPSRNPPTKNNSSYEIHLPSDETFFCHLVLDFFQYPSDDLRAAVPREGYQQLAISDKGQNLRGVISLFGSLSSAFGIMTNKYWRTVLAKAKEDSARPLTFDRNTLASFIPNDRGTIERLTKELHFKQEQITKNYLRDSLTDTLEQLVRLNVFYQVAHWQCRYCGYLNSRSFNNMKTKNKCDICATEFLAPIDIEWKYEMSEFVYRSLQKHSGLSVLWALGYLQERLHAGAFWYLPEVDLYETDDDPNSKNEVDILCIRDGTFYGVEAKRSVSMFIHKEGSVDRFGKVIKLLRPDVALLAFERYCAEGEDVEKIKSELTKAAENLREQIGPWTKLEIVIAQDVSGFDDFQADFGWYGSRVHAYSSQKGS